MHLRSLLQPQFRFRPRLPSLEELWVLPAFLLERGRGQEGSYSRGQGACLCGPCSSQRRGPCSSPYFVSARGCPLLKSYGCAWVCCANGSGSEHTHVGSTTSFSSGLVAWRETCPAVRHGTLTTTPHYVTSHGQASSSVFALCCRGQDGGHEQASRAQRLQKQPPSDSREA